MALVALGASGICRANPENGAGHALLSMTILPELVRSFAPDLGLWCIRRHAGFLRRVCRADAVAIAGSGRRF